MARPRHPHKEIEAAIQHAEARGWRVLVGGSHAWGFLYCPHQARDGCKRQIYSTPRNPEGHARRLRHQVDSCPHVQENP